MLELLFAGFTIILVIIAIAILILLSIIYIQYIKYDISFWSSLDTLNGFSVNSFYIRTIFNIISSIYLFYAYPSQYTFLLAFIFITYNYWKYSKVSELKKQYQGDEDVQDIGVEVNGKTVWVQRSYETTLTGVYDEEGIALMKKYVLPFLIVYCCYSFIFKSQFGLIGGVLSGLSDFLGYFGFLLSIPQIYINYKFKSVGPLPWRALTYKIVPNIIMCSIGFLFSGLSSLLSLFLIDMDFFIYIYQYDKYNKVRVKIERVDGNGNNVNY